MGQVPLSHQIVKTTGAVSSCKIITIYVKNNIYVHVCVCVYLQCNFWIYSIPVLIKFLLVHRVTFTCRLVMCLCVWLILNICLDMAASKRYHRHLISKDPRVMGQGLHGSNESFWVTHCHICPLCQIPSATQILLYTHATMNTIYCRRQLDWMELKSII